MVQPAGELLEEIMSIGGQRRVLIGRDNRGRTDVFVYCERKDRVYHIKIERIRPRLKGNMGGYDVEGFGDELCASDGLIENIMQNGFMLEKKDETLERLHKYASEGRHAMMEVGGLDVEGPTELFYAMRDSDPDNVAALRRQLSKNIDGKLSAELNAHLLKRQLGSDSYIR